MPTHYFCFGTTLANMVNIESVVSIPPNVLPSQGGAYTPLQGQIARRVMSGRTRRDGDQNGAWMFDYFDNDMTDIMSLNVAMFGSLTVASRQLYVVTLDEFGRYSPFMCYVVAPYLVESKTITIHDIPTQVRYDLTNCTMQSVSKSSTYTVTTSDHLVYVDCTAGDVTMNLPALAGVTADVPFRFERSEGSNSIVLDPNSTEQIDSASTLTTTGATIIKSGSQWVTI